MDIITKAATLDGKVAGMETHPDNIEAWRADMKDETKRWKSEAIAEAKKAANTTA